MVEAHLIGTLHSNGAAEADSAEHRKFAAAFQQQTFQLQIILIPADGDAVFGDPSEAGHDAVVQWLEEIFHIVNGLKWDAVTKRIDT